jgi:hypothetical protein
MDEILLNKRLIGAYNDVKFYFVDGVYIRNNVFIDFTEGGNNGRYDWIPKNEIWLEFPIDTRDTVPIMVHEYIEYMKMLVDAWGYDKAHDYANTFEIQFRKTEYPSQDCMFTFTCFMNGITYAESKDKEKIQYNLESEGVNITKSADGTYEADAFKAGTWSDTSGKATTYTEKDIDEIATIYNRNKKFGEAPVVIGHPQMDHPAYGWIDSAISRGGHLILKLKELNDGFVKAVQSGAYKTKSLALYGSKYIKHLGVLGAYRPAVPGLENLKFTENNLQQITLYYSEEPMAENTIDLKEYNEIKTDVSWMKRIFGGGQKNFSEPNPEIETLKKQLADLTAQFAEQLKTVETLTAENADLKKKTEPTPEDFKTFCETLVKDGKIRSADVPIEVENLESRRTADKVSNFAEGDGKKSKVDTYKEILSKRGKIVTFGELDLPVDQKPVSASEIDNQIDKRTREIAKEKSIDYAEAFDLAQIELVEKYPEQFKQFTMSIAK